MIVMDYFEDFIKARRPKSTHLYKDIYRVWINYLNNCTCQVFKYSGIDFPSREIERLLQAMGFVGIVKVDKGEYSGVIPAYSSMSGATNFIDMFSQLTWTTPLNYGNSTIGVDCVVGENNYLRKETTSDNELYAHLLTHTDLSIQAILVNNRANMLTSASTQAQADTINNWFQSLANGKLLAITHKKDAYTVLNSAEINIEDLYNRNNRDITDYYRMRDNLLKSFYARWGLVGNQEKAERVISAELDTGLQRALFNVEDMLACRKEMCDKVNAMFGTNWSVDLNTQIERQMETVNDTPTQEIDEVQSEVEDNESKDD